MPCKGFGLDGATRTADPTTLRGLMAALHEELEESITRLESVDAARIVTANGKLTEVHVIAGSDKPPKQVVRDVQSLAMARFGVSIDRRIISVVQISPTALTGHGVMRPAVVELAEEPSGNHTTLKVTLRTGEEQHTGSATGPAVASARLRLIGEATIDALARTFEGMPPTAVDSIAATNVGTTRVLVAVVATVADQGGEHLTVGSSIAGGDDGQATVKAVLNSLNRRLALLGD